MSSASSSEPSIINAPAGPGINYPAHSTPASLGKYLNKPNEYDGKDRQACTTFLAQVKLYMAGNLHLFPNEQSKVLFTATYLRDKAFAWMEPKLNKNSDEEPVLADFALFCKEMVRSLGDPDKEKNMARKLNSLEQHTSAANYRTEFDQIAQYLTWDDSALRSRFYEGLKTKVKDALSYVVEEPVGFKDFQDLVIRLDGRIHDREIEGRKGGRTFPTSSHHNRTTASTPRANTTSTTTTRTASYNGPQAMDLDATRSKAFKPLTPQERTHRMTNNLCLYCGKAGHRASDCPARRGKNNFKGARLHTAGKTYCNRLQMVGRH